MILKETNPIEVSELSCGRNIEHEPAFSWWIPYTMSKRDTIFSSITHRLRKTTQKYGIEIPSNLANADNIDTHNGDTLWQKSVSKEMSNVKVAFEIMADDENVPEGYTKSSGQLIFDVKIDFTWKSRWVKDDHRTPDPA